MFLVKFSFAEAMLFTELGKFLFLPVGAFRGSERAGWNFLEDALGISATLAFLAAPLGGIALAWVASLLFDVFAGTAPPGSAPE